MKKKIFIGADHNGYDIKSQLVKYFEQKEISFQDVGSHKFDPQDDYPDIAEAVAVHVAKNNGLGILICGSSFGVCIAANKVKGIRAASISSVAEALIAKQDDDVNILCLAAGKTKNRSKNIGITVPSAKKIIGAWLSASLSKAKRHQRRINKINALEGKHCK